MFLSPVPFGKTILEPNILKEDRKSCIKAGPCGMGRRALFLNSFYISRRYYVVYSEIRRVFKRIAMSSGGFTGKGMFTTIPYLVVVLKDGREKQCNFKSEQDVDNILSWMSKNHPEISLVTEKAEKAAPERQGELKADIPKEVQREIDRLQSDIAYLEKKPEVYQGLSVAVRRKRTIDQMPMSSILTVSAIAAVGLIGLVLVGICAAIFVAATLFVRNSWYVGANGETVGVYHGVNATLLGHDLYALSETSAVQLSDLPDAVQTSLQEGVVVSSEEEAHKIIQGYQDQIATDRERAQQVADKSTAATEISHDTPAVPKGDAAEASVEKADEAKDAEGDSETDTDEGGE